MKTINVRLRGDFALFNAIPGIEKVSADIITPAAIRNILQQIYWKPQFQWVVKRIKVVNPIRRISMTTTGRNTISDGHSASKDGSMTLAGNSMLVDVDYVCEVGVDIVRPDWNNRNDELRYKLSDHECVEKHLTVFVRRVQHHKQYRQPYFGKRECFCDVSLVDNFDDVPTKLTPSEANKDYGMVYCDMQYRHLTDEEFENRKKLGGIVEQMPYTRLPDHIGEIDKNQFNRLSVFRITPLKYHCNMVNGVVCVPHYSTWRDIGLDVESYRKSKPKPKKEKKPKKVVDKKVEQVSIMSLETFMENMTAELTSPPPPPAPEPIKRRMTNAERLRLWKENGRQN